MIPTLSEKILNICKEVFPREEILAVALYGSRAGGYARIDSNYDILLIINNYLSELRYHNHIFDETYLSILAVDQDLLEFDAEEGGLGDFISGRLTSPYVSLQNREYLKQIELIVKRRFIEEDLLDLTFEYGILAKELIIKPEYFALARMRKRSRLYPPLRYSYYYMLRKDLKIKNLNNILKGYKTVLKRLEEEGYIRKVDENICLTDHYVDKNLSNRTLKQVINVVQLGQKTINSYLVHGLAGLSSYNIIIKELTSKIKRELQSRSDVKELEDPKNYLFLETSKGLVSLNERASIIEASMKFKKADHITIQPLGGILNEVYLIEADNEKIVAKKFTDWFGFKWFTLNLVALGSKQFTVAGKERLANEYSMNLILSKKEISVPEILFINPEERLLLTRYINGLNVLELVRNSFYMDKLSEKQISYARDIGKLFAKIHSENISIGDNKPENLIISERDQIYIVDLEQASQGGDFVWDVAEFLYYAGHFGFDINSGFLDFIKAVIGGYVEGGGEVSTLRNAANLLYYKSFLIWTSTPIIMKIREILKKS